MSLIYAGNFQKELAGPIGITGPCGSTGITGITGTCGYGPSGSSEYNEYPYRFSLDYDAPKIKTKICPKCCGKGKVEKQGWFGKIKIVKCKCKRSTR